MRIFALTSIISSNISIHLKALHRNQWMLTRTDLTSAVSVILLQTTVLIQSHDESGWQPSQFQKFWAVQLAGYQSVFSGRTLELQLQLWQKGFSSCPCCLLLTHKGQPWKAKIKCEGSRFYAVTYCILTSRFGSFSQASPRAKQNLSDCVFS